ncbi:hypothetical protein D3C81_1792590 [compost metagenome]
MAQSEQPHLHLAHPESVRQALEYQIATVRAIALQAQSGQGQRVGGVVGEVEAAGEGQRRVVGVL